MQHRHWTPDHRDAVLRRVTAVTVGTAVIGAAGAFGLGFGMVSAAQAVDKQAPAAGTTTVAAGPTAASAVTPSAKATPAATKAAAAKKAAATATAKPTATKKLAPPPAPPAPAPVATKAAATSGGS